MSGWDGGERVTQRPASVSTSLRTSRPERVAVEGERLVVVVDGDEAVTE